MMVVNMPSQEKMATVTVHVGFESRFVASATYSRYSQVRGVKSPSLFRYWPVLTVWNAWGTVVGEVVDGVDQSLAYADLATVERLGLTLACACTRYSTSPPKESLMSRVLPV
jgi:hypothetical protein